MTVDMRTVSLFLGQLLWGLFVSLFLWQLLCGLFASKQDIKKVVNAFVLVPTI